MPWCALGTITEYILCFLCLASKNECENFDDTTTVETDDDSMPRRKKIKKSYPEFVANSKCYSVTYDNL